MKALDRRHVTARAGEALVASLLPNAVNVNLPKDAKLPYDVIWQGIKIDVKATSRVTDRASFNVAPSGKHKGILLVYVGITDETSYLWVERYRDKPKKTWLVGQAISADKLPEAILELSALPPENITLPEQPWGYENIGVLRGTKRRFIRQYNAAKKGKRHFYMDDYLNSLLDLETQA